MVASGRNGGIMTDPQLAALAAAATAAGIVVLWRLLDWLAGKDDEFPPL